MCTSKISSDVMVIFSIWGHIEKMKSRSLGYRGELSNVTDLHSDNGRSVMGAKSPVKPIYLEICNSCIFGHFYRIWYIILAKSAFSEDAASPTINSTAIKYSPITNYISSESVFT